MTDSQKLEFYKRVLKKNLNWDNFFFEVLPSSPDKELEITTKISYNDCSYYFKYIYNAVHDGLVAGGWLIEHSPGDNYKPIKSFIVCNSFEDVLVEYSKWLNNLIKEINAKDYLDSINEIKYGIDTVFHSQFSDKEYFNSIENEKIKIELNNFREFIKENIADENHLSIIEEKIDYLIDRIKYPKIDWINIFVSTVVQLSLNETIYFINNFDFIVKLKELLFNILKICNFLIGS